MIGFSGTQPNHKSWRNLQKIDGKSNRKQKNGNQKQWNHISNGNNTKLTIKKNISKNNKKNGIYQTENYEKKGITNKKFTKNRVIITIMKIITGEKKESRGKEKNYE